MLALNATLLDMFHNSPVLMSSLLSDGSGAADLQGKQTAIIAVLETFLIPLLFSGLRRQ